MTKKLTFSPASIAVLKSGKIADPLTPGLYIEALSSGKKVWKYRRRIAGGDALKTSLGPASHHTIADARKWAAELNDKLERGINPFATAPAHDAMTVDQAHAIYLEAVALGQHRIRKRSGANMKPRPRTVQDKRVLYTRNVQPVIGDRPITEVTVQDINAIVEAKSKTGPVQANRLGAELRVFFGFCLSPRGVARGIKLEANPTAEVADLWNTESAGKTRWIDEKEMPILLKALAAEERQYRRAILLWILSGTRFSELVGARSAELQDGVWVIPAARVKNGCEHPISLGPWGLSLFQSDGEWVFPSDRCDGPHTAGWPKVITRIRKRMVEIAGRPIEHFTPHDLRRTFCSWLDDEHLGLSEALIERMMNHKLAGVKARYKRAKRAREMAVGFHAWDQYLGRMAIEAGVGEALEVVTKEAETQPMPEPPTA